MYKNVDVFARAVFTENEILDIRDMFLDVSDEYGFEEDPNGNLYDYMTSSAERNNDRLNRGRPQFFVQKTERVDKTNGNGCIMLILAVVFSQNFITDELLRDIDDVKDRLTEAGYVCGETVTYKIPIFSYVKFYINKNYYKK